MAVVDIDGTVADARHRLPLIAGEATHEQWVRFFAAADVDPPIEEGVAWVREHAEQYDIVWITGRPERIRDLTARWLEMHSLPARNLIMYPEDERRPARLVKLERVRELISADREIAVVIDDDPRVIELMKSEGFPTYLAEWIPWQPVE